MEEGCMSDTPRTEYVNNLVAEPGFLDHHDEAEQYRTLCYELERELATAIKERDCERSIKEAEKKILLQEIERREQAERERDEAKRKHCETINQRTEWVERAVTAERERNDARKDATNFFSRIGDLEAERDEARECLLEVIAEVESLWPHIEKDFPRTASKWSLALTAKIDRWRKAAGSAGEGGA
jgi:chromosome segregation ATPase